MVELEIKGIYVFWYCNRHNDGTIAYYPSTSTSTSNFNLDAVYQQPPPQFLNVCYCNSDDSERLKSTHCDYVLKGIVECISDIHIIELLPVQLSFERENGGFKFEYYFQNIYYVKNDDEITLYDYDEKYNNIMSHQHPICNFLRN